MLLILVCIGRQSGHEVFSAKEKAWAGSMVYSTVQEEAPLMCRILSPCSLCSDSAAVPDPDAPSHQSIVLLA